jgi:peptidoglycan hydrolase-like protein with peptidoglycan-binding domain
VNVKPLRTLQSALGLSGDAVDGRPGPTTRALVQTTLQRHNPKTKTDWRAWPAERQAVLCLQVLCERAGFAPGDLDGLWGPQTAFASDQLAWLQAHGEPPAPWRIEPVAPNPNAWPLEQQDALTAFYGPPGESRLVLMDLPYPMRLAWDLGTVVRRTRCNARVKDSLGRVLAAVLAHYGIGCRACPAARPVMAVATPCATSAAAARCPPMAGASPSTLTPTTTSSSGTRPAPPLRSPQYDAWWQCWEAEGWVSLGRTRNYDWMHVQAARV